MHFSNGREDSCAETNLISHRTETKHQHLHTAHENPVVLFWSTMAWPTTIWRIHMYAVMQLATFVSTDRSLFHAKRCACA